MTEPHPEAVLLGSYALFLLGVAAGLDLLARHSHRRSQRFRTAGFSYHAHLDAWECPEGQHLWPHGHDRERRLVRYRGRPQVCNACPSKPVCTDSDEGREIVRFLDDWPRLEAGRFHRGLALTLIVLAALITGTALFRHHDPTELAALGIVLALSGFAGHRLGRGLRGPARREPSHSSFGQTSTAPAVSISVRTGSNASSRFGRPSSRSS